MYVYLYIYIYIYIYMASMFFGGGAPVVAGAGLLEVPRADLSTIHELCHLYPYPCPKKLYKLPAVLFCYTFLFYKLAWAWAWV